MSQYFPPYNNSSENIKVELDLSNYATKKDINDITHVDVSGLAKVTSIEGQIAGVTKNMVDNLADITKPKAIDTNSFVLKTKLACGVTTLENKIDTVDK